MSFSRESSFLWHPFSQMKAFFEESPPSIARGKGCELFDVDGNAYIDELGPVPPAGGGSKGRPDFFEQGHPFGIMADEALQGGIQESHHIPDRMAEVVRPPTKFVRIIQAVGNHARAGGR